MTHAKLSRGKWLLVAALCAGAALVAWLSTGQTPVVERLGLVERVALRCTPSEGDLASYHVRLYTQLKMNAAALLTDSHGKGQMLTSDAGFSARLRTRAMEPRGEGMLVAMQLDDIEVVSGVADASKELMRELQHPFFAVLEPNCRLSEFGFAKDVSDEAQNRLRGMLHGFSMKLDDDREKLAWTTFEYDSVGKYAARYDREPDARSRELKKKRFSYVKLHPSPGFKSKDDLVVRVLSSAMTAALDDELTWLSHAESRDHLQIVRKDGGLVADLKMTIWLEKSREATAPFDMALTAGDASWVKDEAPPVATDPQKPEPPDEMKTMSLELALAQYTAIMRSGAENNVGKASDFLALYLRARPDMAFELMKLLAQNAVPPDLQSTLFLALEKADTPEAHDALISGLSEEHSANNRARAAAALPDIEKPAQKTLEALKKTATEGKAANADETTLVRNSARYAIGTLEARTRDGNPKLAAQAVAEMREGLSRAHEPAELAAALDAIGNSGNRTLLTDVQPHLAADEVLVRAHAIQAMGHMDPEANKGLFGTLIERESDPQVRGTVAVTYAEQAKRANRLPPKDVLDAAIARLPLEPDPRVRGLLIDLIGPSCATYPFAMQALAAQFRRESDPMLLKLIGKYVPAGVLGA